MISKFQQSYIFGKKKFLENKANNENFVPKI